MINFLKTPGWLPWRRLAAKAQAARDFARKAAEEEVRLKDAISCELEKSVSELRLILRGQQEQIDRLDAAIEQLPTKAWAEESIRGYQISSTFLPDPGSEMAGNRAAHDAVTF